MKMQKENNMKALIKTNFNFKNQKSVYHGKVRDVYNINDELLVMIVTDRISAFDVVLPKGIPYKGMILNQIASKFLDKSSDILPNWKLASPDPVVTIGEICKPYPIEIIVRAYITGSAWREYQQGNRTICGIKLPNGLKEHQKLEKPIITPTTKAENGKHDENISREDIIKNNIIKEDEYKLIENYALNLFERGTQIAEKQGLILVDTKYEFGKNKNKIYLIDEIHTPDSSRYFYKNTYQNNFDKGLQQKQLSKEFVREWLMSNNFKGNENEIMPEMTDEVVEMISNRYIELYEQIIGEKFYKNTDDKNIEERIFNNVNNFIINYYK